MPYSTSLYKIQLGLFVAILNWFLIQHGQGWSCQSVLIQKKK